MFSGSDHDHPMLQYSQEMERKWKSNVELAPSCPRCTSPNTKFCYYNNYSLSQPRYFCKGCRRYWTKGGLLRNVPVGRGCRKNRRAKSSRRVSENSVNQSKSFGGFDDSRNKQITDGESSVGANGGSDIDLAVVFANFLNASSSSEPEFASQEMANNSSNSSAPQTVQINDGILMDSQNPSDHHLVIGDGNFLKEFPQFFDIGEKLLKEDDHTVQNLLENDMNAYGLQTLLSYDHEIQQDVLWSDAATTAATRPNFTWQPMFQLQDFNSFPDDGQLKTSANFTSNNWNPFDLSGFDIYSRPLI